MNYFAWICTGTSSLERQFGPGLVQAAVILLSFILFITVTVIAIKRLRKTGFRSVVKVILYVISIVVSLIASFIFWFIATLATC